jgi:hypothetical protein
MLGSKLEILSSLYILNIGKIKMYRITFSLFATLGLILTSALISTADAQQSCCSSPCHTIPAATYYSGTYCTGTAYSNQSQLPTNPGIGSTLPAPGSCGSSSTWSTTYTQAASGQDLSQSWCFGGGATVTSVTDLSGCQNSNSPGASCSITINFACPIACGTCSVPCTSAITITDATYGADCGASNGNVTSKVASICNNQTSCSFVEGNTLFGDPTPGCAKDFSVIYTCSCSGNTKSSSAPAQSGENYTISLSCP